MSRDYTISYIRVIAMLLVILGHSLAIYSSTVPWPFEKSSTWYWISACKIIYALHMPVFFVISGYLYSHLYTFCNKYQSARQTIEGKFKRLIAPYIFWVTIQAIIFNKYLSPDTIYNGGFHLWFLLSLFWQFIIFTSFRHFWKKYSIQVQVAILFSLLLIIKVGHIAACLPDILCIHSAVNFLPFFYFGIIAGKLPEASIIYAQNTGLQAKSHSISKIIYLTNLLSLIIFVCVSLSLPVDHYGSLFSTLQALALMAMISTSYIILKGKVIRNQQIQNVVLTLDRCSMGIYILHHVIIWLMLTNGTTLSWLLAHYNCGPCVLFLTSLVISWQITILLMETKYSKYVIG